MPVTLTARKLQRRKAQDTVQGNKATVYYKIFDPKERESFWVGINLFFALAFRASSELWRTLPSHCCTSHQSICPALSGSSPATAEPGQRMMTTSRPFPGTPPPCHPCFGSWIVMMDCVLRVPFHKENILLCPFHSTLQFAVVWGWVFRTNTQWKGKDVIPGIIHWQPSSACINPWSFSGKTVLLHTLYAYFILPPWVFHKNTCSGSV